MIWSLINLAPQAAEHAAEQSETTAAGEHIPILVEWVNNLLGPTVYRIQQVIMPTFYSWFGAEWQGDPEMPIPKHMVMFFIAVFISTVILYWLRGKLSVEKPTNRQQSFEILIEGLRSLIKENIGPARGTCKREMQIKQQPLVTDDGFCEKRSDRDFAFFS